jgi:hypothetical protein
MRQISSKLTFYYKWIFPIFWFGFLAIFLVLALLGITSPKESFPIMFVIVPIIMTVVGYSFMKKLVFDLVDEVLDDGSALIVKNGRQEERIALSDITNVNYSADAVAAEAERLRRPHQLLRADAFCHVRVEPGHRRVDRKDRRGTQVWSEAMNENAQCVARNRLIAPLRLTAGPIFRS